MADDESTRDGVKPGGKAGFGAVEVELLPGGDEGFLRHVLGVLATGEFLAEEMKEASLMATHQFLKRGERSALGVAGELLVVDGWCGVFHGSSARQ